MDVLKGSPASKFVDSSKVTPTNEATASVAAAAGGGTGVNNGISDDGVIPAIDLVAAFHDDSVRTAGGGEHQEVHVGESNV